jgi:hypothetical protein
MGLAPKWIFFPQTFFEQLLALLVLVSIFNKLKTAKFGTGH